MYDSGQIGPLSYGFAWPLDGISGVKRKGVFLQLDIGSQLGLLVSNFAC